jgi:RHS repeat-associated protein
MMVKNTSSPIAQETHYDPWGLELAGIGFQYGGFKANKYLYNGKELIEDAGLQYYDYGARMYDPVKGSWLNKKSVLP